jgi:hypothetical protein
LADARTWRRGSGFRFIHRLTTQTAVDPFGHQGLE